MKSEERKDIDFFMYQRMFCFSSLSSAWKQVKFCVVLCLEASDIFPSNFECVYFLSYCSAQIRKVICLYLI